MSDKELSGALAEILIGLTVLIGTQVAKGTDCDPEDVEMTDGEAAAITRPILRILERTSGTRYAHHIIEGKDWLVAVAAIISYTDRLSPVIQRKRYVRASTRPARQQKPNPRQKKAEFNGNPVRSDTPTEPRTEWTAGVPGGYGIGPQNLDT